MKGLPKPWYPFKFLKIHVIAGLKVDVLAVMGLNGVECHNLVIMGGGASVCMREGVFMIVGTNFFFKFLCSCLATDKL